MFSKKIIKWNLLDVIREVGREEKGIERKNGLKYILESVLNWNYKIYWLVVLAALLLLLWELYDTPWWVILLYLWLFTNKICLGKREERENKLKIKLIILIENFYD